MKFYDHAKNNSPAQGAAIAHARHEAIRDGEAYKIIFQVREDSEIFYWTGCHHDILALAKSLIFNEYHLVEVTRSDNTVMTVQDIKESRY